MTTVFGYWKACYCSVQSSNSEANLQCQSVLPPPRVRQQRVDALRSHQLVGEVRELVRVTLWLGRTLRRSMQQWFNRATYSYIADRRVSALNQCAMCAKPSSMSAECNNAKPSRPAVLSSARMTL